MQVGTELNEAAYHLLEKVNSFTIKTKRTLLSSIQQQSYKITYMLIKQHKLPLKPNHVNNSKSPSLRETS